MDHLLDRLEGLDVLLLDDDRARRELLRAILRDLGTAPLRELGDPEAALVALGRQPADVVILDWLSGPVDSLDFVRRLRALPDPLPRRIPVLLATAHTELWRVQAARDAGVTEFLARPISVRAVAERLVMMLERPRPFVRSPVYTGPDRRRRADAPAGEERRGDPARTALAQADIDGLLGLRRR